MSLINDLNKHRGLYALCPNCQESFPLSKAGLFDATKQLPPEALEYLADQKESIRQLRDELRSRQQRAKSRPEIGAEASNIGKVVEKIAPSLPGFPVQAGDCRALFEPIDYVVFQGLSSSGKVDSLLFVDVKSGKGRLSGVQRQVRQLVEHGKISLKITARAEEAP